MKRRIRRMLLLTCLVVAAAGALFVGVAKANYFGAATVTCTTATYDYSTFPSGPQQVRETIWIDGVLVVDKMFDFTGPTGGDTVSYTVPNDGASHYVEADGYSITNQTPVFGLPGAAT